MVASADVLYAIRRRSSPRPAMVRARVQSGLGNAPNRAAGDDDDDELHKLGERIAEKVRALTRVATPEREAGGHARGFGSAADPIGSSGGPGEGQGNHPVERGCPISRLSYPMEIQAAAREAMDDSLES